MIKKAGAPNVMKELDSAEYLSDDYKENSSEELNASEEMKRKLFENLKKAGVLDGMKSTLRGKLYEQLRMKGKPDKKGGLSFKIAASVIADLMKKCDMLYALSVFLPESGFQQELLTKSELLEVLALKKDEHYMASAANDSTPLLLDLIDVIKASGSLRPNKVSSFVQTEEVGESGMTLEQKLKRVEHSVMDNADRLVPFKTLEERMLKYKREIELKAKEDLESEIRRLKEFEMSKLRIEEAQKYRLKIQEYRDELEALQQEKLRELKMRESEAWERIKNRERDLDKTAFEIR